MRRNVVFQCGVYMFQSILAHFSVAFSCFSLSWRISLETYLVARPRFIDLKVQGLGDAQDRQLARAIWKRRERVCVETRCVCVCVCVCAGGEM